MAISPRRILVTGATGFVGRHLTSALASAFPDATLVTPRFDVRAEAEVVNIVRDAAPDTCIHLAAISSNAMALPDEDGAWAINLHGTLRLARALLLHAPDCQLVFASTALAYGAPLRDGDKLDERAPLAPLNTYEATKAAADLALGAMVQQGLRVVRLRPFNHTGPGQSSGLVVASFARQVARIEAGLQAPVMEVGNLGSSRDFIDVRDVCAAYVACVMRRDAIARDAIFNLASGEPRRIGDVLEELKELAGVTAEIRVDPKKTRMSDLPLACCDASRARDVLGWTPATPWRQTLQDVLDDWRCRIAAEPESP